MTKLHVLVVEDEQRIASLVAKYLELEGYDCTCLNSGGEVIRTVRDTHPDICILDVMLPEVDGLALCQQIREFSDIPIIMLSARVEEIDRLMGFKHGADDYVCKPFSPSELMARIAALLKRVRKKDITESSKKLTFKGLQLDVDKFAVTLQHQDIKLTVNEFNILKTMMGSPERVFTRKELLLTVKQLDADIYERTIDSHIKNLRKKLNQAAHGQSYIVSIYGMGYSLKAQ